jgi:hypothetical protein
MSLPHFICIGAQKAGTTWLYEMLAQNPGIWLPPMKEVHFFDRIGAHRESAENRRAHILGRALKIMRRGVKKGSASDDQPAFLETLAGEDVGTEAWYRRIFSHPDALTRVSGEITPAYLTIGEPKIAYAKSLLPRVRLVLIVREPQERGISQVKMAASRLKSSRVTDADMKQILDRYKQSDRGNYKKSIPLWQKHFTDQLLILPFSLLRTDPAVMLRTIEEFVGAPAYHGYKYANKPVHKTKEIKVPDWVVSEIGEFTAGQKQYLIDAFGTEFYGKTR